MPCCALWRGIGGFALACRVMQNIATTILCPGIPKCFTTVIGGGTGDEHGLDAGDTGPFTYALTGGEMGYHFNMGKKKVFFMDLAFGLKWCQWLTSDPNGGSTQFFYLTGPGSVIDANFHLGFQLGH